MAQPVRQLPPLTATQLSVTTSPIAQRLAAKVNAQHASQPLQKPIVIESAKPPTPVVQRTPQVRRTTLGSLPGWSGGKVQEDAEVIRGPVVCESGRSKSFLRSVIRSMGQSNR